MPEKHIQISPDTPIKKIAELYRTSKDKQTYQAIVEDASAVRKLLTYIMDGNPHLAEILLKTNPELFFKKGEVTDKFGLTVYNASPYQLMLFLGDADMLDKVKRWIPTDEASCRKLLEQDEEMQGGGEDLVRLKQKPELLSYEDMSTLLKNRNGIIFFQDKLYYIERDLEHRKIKLELINTHACSKLQLSLLDQFKTSMATMEKNTSTRSNDKEYKLIAEALGHRLERKGIQYVQNYKRYQDTRIGFSLLNHYRTYIRLVKEKYSCERLERFLVEDVAPAQRETAIWLLQWFCSRQPFYPLPDFKKIKFERSNDFFNLEREKRESILSSQVKKSLGNGVFLYKADMKDGAYGDTSCMGTSMDAASCDFVALQALVDLNMGNLVKLRQELVEQAGKMIRQTPQPI